MYLMRLFLDSEASPISQNFVPCMIIVQARLGSTRLAGKVLRPILGKPMLGYQLERLRRVRGVEGIVVATTTNPQDQPIVDFCTREGLHYIRGSEDDVLSRYVAAADAFGLEAAVRITSDCPLIDPALIEKGVGLFMQSWPSLDYLSICHERTYPIGMDFEIMRADALKKAFYEAKTAAEKEHVTPYIWQHPELFRLANLQQKINQSSYRLTVDTQEDLQLIERIFAALYPKNPEFTLQDVLDLLALHPDWRQLNAHVPHRQI